jgi:ribulose-phosphate 3-epimerase
MMREEDGLPMWDQIDYELDLMVKHPDENLEQWIALAPKRIILHIESLKDPEKAFTFLQDYREAIEIGISFDNNFNLDALDSYLPYVDFVQCMGIDDIGEQGQPLSEEVFDNIGYLKKKHPHVLISVDGSVNNDTVHDFVSHGVVRLVAGSAVYGHGDPVDNINTLRDLIT